jgi:hypothetical protein
MFNKRVLSKIKMGKSVRPNPYKKDIIVDPMGQWNHPGKNTRIPSDRITMKGVNYPVLGVSNTGQKQMMQPGREYDFPGADYVDEYPQMAKGGAACPSGQKIYPDFKSFGCLTQSQYDSLKQQKTVYLNKRNAASKKIIALKNAGKFNEYAQEVKKFKTEYPNQSYVCPGPDCPKEVLKVPNIIVIQPPKTKDTPPPNPVIEKPIDPVRPPAELEIKVPTKIDYDFSDLKLQGELPETELPQYNQYNYQTEVPTLDIKLPKRKIARLFDRGVIDSKGHIKRGEKEITRPIPSLIQKSTGYDPSYMEGYEDEEGNYIPGEIEKAQQEGRRINFRGASSLKDLREQKRYNQEWDKINNDKKLRDLYTNAYSNKSYKAGGSSEQKIIFAPNEGGCPDGQYWTGTECKPIPKNTKIVYSQEELDKLNLTKKQQQQLYNQYITRLNNRYALNQARGIKYPQYAKSNIKSLGNYYKTFESIPTHGFMPYMSYGPSKLIPDGLSQGVPAIDEDMVPFSQYKKMMDKSPVKPVGFWGHPGGGHFFPVYEKPGNYILGYNREEKKLDIEPIKPPAIPLRVDNGILPPLQQSTYVPQEPIEAPQYTLDSYTAERPYLDVQLPQNKIKRLFDRGVIDSKGHIELGRKDKTRLIPRIVQKITGYDPEYFEGSYDEEGNYIPGELDYGNEVGGRMEFRGAASLQDLINQQKYAKDWEEYERKIDEREEQSKKKQEQGQAFKKGGAKKKFTSDIINSTNYLFAEHPLFKKKKQSKKRIYSPNAKYYQDGGELPEASYGYSVGNLIRKQDGGDINYQLGDEVDEATMRRLKKLGFTFEKI